MYLMAIRPEARGLFGEGAVAASAYMISTLELRSNDVWRCGRRGRRSVLAGRLSGLTSACASLDARVAIHQRCRGLGLVAVRRDRWSRATAANSSDVVQIAVSEAMPICGLQCGRDPLTVIFPCRRPSAVARLAVRRKSADLPRIICATLGFASSTLLSIGFSDRREARVGPTTR